MLFLSFLLACGPRVPPTPPEPPASAPEEPPAPAVASVKDRFCFALWERTSGFSVLAEQRASGGPRFDDFPTAFPARAPTPEDPHSVHLELFRFDSLPIFWFDKGYSGVFVTDKVFSDLTVVDVTSLPDGEERVIGTVSAAGREALLDRGVLGALIMSDILQTYAHLGSNVCLVEERQTADYRARLEAEHTYMTNRENTASYGFLFTIDPAGTMRVKGFPPVPPGQ